ncbi:MAG: hypothetical protein LWX83_14630 [Anaerolineae bacterium]|nr:hypothetical protein [Anaerolineae bacterium]
MKITSTVLKISAVILLLFILAEGVYALAVRPWVMRWGATDAEVALKLNGDQHIPPGSVTSTRAVTIHAPVEKVWPWVLQLGQERGGFYSYTFFENTFGAQMVNADHLLPEDKTIKVGDRFSYFGNGPEGTFSTVTEVEPRRLLGVSGWTFYLQPLADNNTRLVVRYFYDHGHTFMGQLIYFGMFEQAHFIMESGMLMGIKRLAESTVN